MGSFGAVKNKILNKILRLSFFTNCTKYQPRLSLKRPNTLTYKLPYKIVSSVSHIDIPRCIHGQAYGTVEADIGTVPVYVTLDAGPCDCRDYTCREKERQQYVSSE